MSKDVTAQFFETMFGQALEDGLGSILIWTLPDKKSHYFKAVAEATEFAHSVAKTHNVYFGVGLCPDGLKSNQRAEETQVVGIPCLHADFDFEGPGKKKRYPKDFEHVRKIIKELGVEPTIINLSGGGCHAYWVFKEIWKFDDNKDRYAAKDLCRLWNMTLRTICGSYGCTIDSTFDLARVLRVPGTYNLKSEPPKLVKMVLFEPGNKFLDSDLEEYCVAEEFCSRNEHSVVQVGEFKIPSTEDTKLPKVAEDLIKNDGKFQRWWEKNRGDLADQSASSYDMVVANEGTYRNWSEQDMVNTMMAWRIKYEENPDKLKRRNYVTNTIGRAMLDRGNKYIMKEIRKEIENAGGETDEAVDAVAKSLQGETKKKMLAIVSRYVGRKVVRVIQFGKENSQYAIEVEKKGGVVETITLGDESVMTSPSKFDGRLYDKALSLDYDGPSWRKDSRVFVYAAEVIDIESATDYTQTKNWLQAYFNGSNIETSSQWWTAWKKGKPFVLDGKLYIDLTRFKRFLNTIVGVKPKLEEIQHRIHAVGMRPDNIEVPDPVGQRADVWFIETDLATRISLVSRSKVSKQDAINDAEK